MFSWSSLKTRLPLSSEPLSTHSTRSFTFISVSLWIVAFLFRYSCFYWNLFVLVSLEHLYSVALKNPSCVLQDEHRLQNATRGHVTFTSLALFWNLIYCPICLTEMLSGWTGFAGTHLNSSLVEAEVMQRWWRQWDHKVHASPLHLIAILNVQRSSMMLSGSTCLCFVLLSIQADPHSAFTWADWSRKH